MNRKDRGILIGMSFGDGHITDKGKFVMIHCKAQKQYAEHKAELIHSIFGGYKPNVKDINNNGYPGVRYAKQHKYFRLIRKRLYVNRKKVFSVNILKHLTVHGLALWWMDDGSVYMKRHNGKVHAREGILSTYVSIEENKLIADRIEELTSVRHIPVHNKGKFRLRFNTGMLKIFLPIM